jgi:hypothetical protein
MCFVRFVTGFGSSILDSMKLTSTSKNMVTNTVLMRYLGLTVCQSFNTKCSVVYSTNTFFPGELPVARAAILKHILRSMHRMMQSSGTAEGLRGLIDTSILKSIKKIIDYRGLFGPSIIPIGMSC